MVCKWGWVAIAVAIAATPASAAGLSAEQATELLARSSAANERCKILTGPETTELAAYVQQAATVLATKTNVARASATLAKGKAIGTAVRCDDTSSRAVRAVLQAARSAVADSVPKLRGALEVATVTSEKSTAIPDEVDAPAEIAKPEVLPAAETVATPLPRQVKTKKLPAVLIKVKAKPQQAVSALRATKKTAPNVRLESYASLATVYYHQRRCRNLLPSSLANLYRQVVATHRTSVRVFGVAAVSRTMRQAETRASKRSC